MDLFYDISVTILMMLVGAVHLYGADKSYHLKNSDDKTERAKWRLVSIVSFLIFLVCGLVLRPWQ